MSEPDLTTPVDEEHRISVLLLNEIRAALIGLRQPGWEPAPMPTDYVPSASEVLSLNEIPLDFMPALDGRDLTVSVDGREPYFLDYRVR